MTGLDQLALHRRDALRIGGYGFLGLTMPKLLRAVEALKSEQAPLRVRAKRVIFLFQWGGPSHIDMFDRKPKAPSDIRGPLQSISSACHSSGLHRKRSQTTCWRAG